jgi:hypothetical protein
MTAEEFQAITTLAGSLSLTTFLFALWWLERAERIKCQDEKQQHLDDDIERLLDETENLRLKP